MKFSLQIRNTDITYNLAVSGNGGGMAIFSNSLLEKNTLQSITLLNTKIHNNTANIGGGIYYNNFLPSFKNSPIE